MQSASASSSSLTPPFFYRSPASDGRREDESLPQSPGNSSRARFSLSGFPLIFRYVLAEIAVPFTLALFCFTGVLFLARILRLIDLVVNKNVPLGDILLLFSYVIPGFLEIALPMALLLGVLLAFNRLSSDSELIVMRSCGISLSELARPVLVMALATFLLAGAISFWIRPWANYRLGVGLFEIMKLRTSSGLSAGVFNDFGPLTIYAESVDPVTGKLTNVIIADRREPELSRNFIARYGQVITDEAQRSLSLQLYDGSIQEGSGLNFNVTSFQVNMIRLPQEELLEDGSGRGGKRSNEFSLGELVQAKNALAERSDELNEEDALQLARYRVEFQRRLVIPFSAFCVALAAMALGIQPTRGAHSWGTTANVSLGISLILVYYLFLAMGSAIASQGQAPAWLVLWIPNVLFAALGVYLFRQLGTEKWQAVNQAMSDFSIRIAKKARMLLAASS